MLLISLLALNGLRVSEATGADIEQLGLERGHRTLTITRKGGTVVTIPLAPRTARAIDLAIVSSNDRAVLDALLRIPPRHLIDLSGQLSSEVESLPGYEGLGWGPVS